MSSVWPGCLYEVNLLLSENVVFVPPSKRNVHEISGGFDSSHEETSTPVSTPTVLSRPPPDEGVRAVFLSCLTTKGRRQ